MTPEDAKQIVETMAEKAMKYPAEALYVSDFVVMVEAVCTMTLDQESRLVGLERTINMQKAADMRHAQERKAKEAEEERKRVAEAVAEKDAKLKTEAQKSEQKK